MLGLFIYAVAPATATASIATNHITTGDVVILFMLSIFFLGLIVLVFCSGEHDAAAAGRIGRGGGIHQNAGNVGLHGIHHRSNRKKGNVIFYLCTLDLSFLFSF